MDFTCISVAIVAVEELEGFAVKSNGGNSWSSSEDGTRMGSSHYAHYAKQLTMVDKYNSYKSIPNQIKSNSF